MLVTCQLLSTSGEKSSTLCSLSGIFPQSRLPLHKITKRQHSYEVKHFTIYQTLTSTSVNIYRFDCVTGCSSPNKYTSQSGTRLLLPISTLGEQLDCKSSYMHQTASERREKYLQEPLLYSQCIATAMAAFA